MTKEDYSNHPGNPAAQPFNIPYDRNRKSKKKVEKEQKKTNKK